MVREDRFRLSRGALGPMLFTPILKQACWGGSRLGVDLGKNIGPENDYAESWELADLPHQQSVIANGPYEGWFLDQIRDQFPEQLYGTQTQLSEFPVLVKFLDIQNRLSIQVHPNDFQAYELAGGVGKTESWVVLEATPESLVYVGFQEPVSREDFEHFLSEGGVENCLHSFPVRSGDVIHIPAGTVHAVSGSVLLAEVQQSSDLSYRLSDWDRHLQGEIKRELHLEEALFCLNFKQGPVDPVEPQRLGTVSHHAEVLVECEHYTIHRHVSNTPFNLMMDDQFKIVMVLNGWGRLSSANEECELERGQTWLLPACTKTARIFPDEELTLLEVFVPSA